MKSLVTFLLLLPFFASSQVIDSNLIEPVVDTNQIVYDFAELMPEYPGGVRELYAFLDENVKYPETEDNLYPLVKTSVTIVIGKEGDIEKFTINKKLHPAFEKECARVIGLMPRWNPGKIDGKAVNVKYTFFINFKP